MKKLVIVLVVMISMGWGIEATGLVGFNTQSWDDGNGNVGSGAGFHAGFLGGIGITPSCLPAYVGVESGFLLQNARYSWETGFGGIDLLLKYNNLVIPVLLKANLDVAKKFHLGAGVGPSFIIHTGGETAVGTEDWALTTEISDEDLKTDLGFQVKGEVGIKLIPLLWLKPSVTLQLNPTPYSPVSHENQGSETALLFSVGLAVKP